nr:hypothetical protein HK105_008101 [Polyrhizophydium stewartii]
MDDPTAALELVQLPQYFDYELLDVRIVDDRQMAVQSARSVASPDRTVLLKSTPVGRDDGASFLENEYEALKRIHAFIAAHAEQPPPFRPSLAQRAPISSADPTQTSSEASLSLSSSQPPVAEISAGSSRSSRTDKASAMRRIPKPISYEIVDGVAVLVTEFCSSMPLRRYMADCSHAAGQGLPLEEVIAIALQVAEAIEIVHRARFIHKDINPDNILIRRDSLGGICCELTHFHIAESFDLAIANGASSSQLQGTLAYVSPDFYSFGVTLWEMVVGRPPFVSFDLAEVIYMHIARECESPKDIRPLTPQVLVDVIIKLMKKDVSERYQTATAIKCDLMDINSVIVASKASRGIGQSQLLTDDQISAAIQSVAISIGLHDFSRQLCIPEKLYGRDKELELLESAFGLVRSGESALEFLCIVGNIGFGKSALVRAFEDRITAHKFISKTNPTFDVPLAGFLSVIDQLVKLILSESDEVLKDWERRITQGLSRDAIALLSRLIPSIKTILPETRPTGALVEGESQEMQAEVFRAIESFLGLFATEDRPLAIYVDNVLSAGRGTLYLLKHIFQRKRLRNIFVLGSISPSSNPDFHQIVQELENDLGRPIRILELEPIPIESIRAMLQDAMRPPACDLTELSVLFFRKTQGNPLHVKELLKFCDTHGLVRFDEHAQGWVWDIRELDRKTDLTENVVGLLISEFQRLPSDTQALLWEAACVGFQFESRTMCHLYAASQVASVLAPAVQGGTLSARYKFCHARLHLAIYNSIPADERQQIHLRIATRIKETATDDISERLYEIVHHFNHAKDLVVNQDQQLLVLELNEQAASRAVASNDLALAMGYLDTAMEMITRIGESAASACNFATVFEVKRLRAVVLIRQCAFGEAEDLLHKLSLCAPTERRIQVVQAFSALYHMQSRFSELLEPSLKAIRDTGINIPTSPQELACSAREQFELLRRTIDDAITKCTIWEYSGNQPPSNRIVDELIYHCEGAARVLGDTCMTLFLCTKGCLMAIEDGFGMYAAAHFSMLLQYLCGVDGIFDQKQFTWVANLVQRLQTQLPVEAQACTMTAAIFGMGYIWGAQETIDNMSFYMEAAISANMIGVGVFLGIVLGISAPPTGMPSTAIQSLKANIAKYLSRTPSSSNTNLEYVFDEFERALMSAEHQPNEAIEAKATTLRVKLTGRFLRFFGMCIFQNPSRFDQVDDMDNVRERLTGLCMYVDVALAQVVTYAAISKAHPDRRAECLHKISDLLVLIARVVELQPSQDYACKLLLAQAEYARASDDVSLAVKRYEEAIESAHNKGILLYEAWATELHGLFWLGQKSKRLARMCLVSAAQLWVIWGSDAKSAALQACYSDVLADAGLGRRGSRWHKMPSISIRAQGSDGIEGAADMSSPSRNSTMSDGLMPSAIPKSMSFTSTAFSPRRPPDVDLTTVLKVANSLSNETKLEVLLDKLMDHLTANTGMTHAVLLLNESSRLWITAVASVGADGARHFQIEHTEASTCPDRLPLMITDFVFRNQQTLVFTNMPDEAIYEGDPYVSRVRPSSMLCCPIKHQSNTTGVIYLENRDYVGVFTPSRTEFVQSLMGSASVSIENARLMKRNEELSNALRETEQKKMQQQNDNTPNGPRYNFDSPIKRILEMVGKVKARFAPDDPEMKKLDNILKLLTSDGLYAANIDDVNDENGQSLDQDTKSFLEASLLQRTTKHSAQPVILSSGSELMLNISLASTGRTSSGASLTGSVLSQSFGHSYQPPMLLKEPQPLNVAEIDSYLQNCLTLDFDVFKLAEITFSSPLYYLCMHLMQRFGLFDNAEVPEHVLRMFIQRVESGYHQIAYHNSTHAADVLQTAAMLLLATPLKEKFTKLELFCMCIACAVHDIDHPGVNNTFLVQTSHPMAILYNDAAILESHHAAKAFEIARLPDSNIFANLPPDQIRFSRKLIISIILATGKRT